MRRELTQPTAETLLAAGEFRPFRCALFSRQVEYAMSQEQLMNWVAHLWRYCKQTQASQIAEFAISLPLLAVVVIGITDFGSAFDLKYKLSNAVRAGARVVSTQNTSDVTNPTPLSIAAIHDVVDNYL